MTDYRLFHRKFLESYFNDLLGTITISPNRLNKQSLYKPGVFRRAGGGVTDEKAANQRSQL